MTLKVKDGIGDIDLIGVLSAFQGKGFGSFLLLQAVSSFQSNNIRDIVVVTEGENIPANALYQLNGFVLSSVALAYHRHSL